MLAANGCAYVNSFEHDPIDDSIIVSSRYQSAIVNIDRNNKVKRILSSPDVEERYGLRRCLHPWTAD